MERPQHPALFDQAISDCARMFFGGEQIPEGVALTAAIVEVMTAHEAWITGEALADLAENASDADRATRYRIIQMRSRFAAEPMMFGLPESDEG